MRAMEKIRCIRQIFLSGLDALTRLGGWIAALSLGGIVSITVAEVTMRYFFNRPIEWVGDVAGYLFCVTIFLAMPEVTRRQGHIAVDLLLERLNTQSRKKARQAIRWFTGLLCLVTAWLSFIETVRLAEQGIQTLGVFMIPKWWVSAFIPFGFFMAGAQFLLQAENIAHSNTELDGVAS